MSQIPNANLGAKRRDRLIIGLILFLGTLAIYWPAARFEFVNLDDTYYVSDNPMVKQGLTWNTVKWAFTSTEASLWFPITRLVHLAAWDIFGPNSGGHHLVNFVLHACNALLAFLVFERMTGAPWRCAFFAALFAWHPLRVESVAWVSELKDVLAVLFWLLTMACYLRFLRSRRRQDRLLLIGTYTLGLMCKPSLVTLPFALLLVDVWPLRRLSVPAFLAGSSPVNSTGQGEALSTGPATTWRQAILEKMPLFILAIVLSAATMFTASDAASGNLPLTIRAANAFLSYGRYLGKTFVPMDLAVLYPHAGLWSGWLMVLTFLLCLALSVFALRGAGKRPYFFVGWFWFLGTLIPNIGLVQAGPQAMADRFTYIPSLGLTLLVVWAVANMARHFPFGATGIGILGGIAVAACVGVSRNQLTYWTDSITLFEHALATTVETDLPHYNLGEAYAERGDLETAKAHLETALRLRPDSDEAWNRLGVIYSRRNELAKAIEHYREAIRLNPANINARINYAQSLYLQGRLNEALPEFREIVNVSPGRSLAWYWIGRIQNDQGNVAQAAQSFSRVLELDPGMAGAHYELGAIRMNQGDANSAVRHFRTVLQLKPEDTSVHAKLALALASSGQPAAAAQEYRQALSFDPNGVEPLNNLAWLLATDRDPAVRDGMEAIRLASRACEVTSNQVPSLIGTLAAAYAEAGRFEEASQASRRAELLATQIGQTNIAEKNRELQQLFQQRKAYRQP